MRPAHEVEIGSFVLYIPTEHNSDIIWQKLLNIKSYDGRTLVYCWIKLTTFAQQLEAKILGW